MHVNRARVNSDLFEVFIENDWGNDCIKHYVTIQMESEEYARFNQHEH